MSTKPQRPRPRQDRAKQLFEAACDLIRIAGEPWPRMHCLQAYGGGFHVAKGALSPGSVAVDIWPLREDDVGPDGGPLAGHKVFGCDLEPHGQIYLRSFRRGAWEDQFLSYADAVVKAAEVEEGPEVVDCPTGAGKTRLMQSLFDGLGRGVSC